MAADTETDQAHEHPTVGQYVEIAVILAVVTGLEVGLYYAGLAREITIPALIVLTTLKFVLVIFWFMHLRFDVKLLRRLFYGGLGLAGVIFGLVIAIIFLGR